VALGGRSSSLPRHCGVVFFNLSFSGKMIPLPFESPVWFWLIPVLVAVALWQRRLRLHLPLRAVALLLIVTLLANPRLARQEKSLDLWVLLDRSNSTEGLIDENLSDWLDILEKAKPTASDEIRIINFGSEVLAQGEGETSVYTGGRELTRTGLAMQTTLAIAREDRPARILLFTDGYATEPLVDLAEKLNDAGMPLDYRLVRDEIIDDDRVARLDVPSRTLLGEPFVISVTCRGHADGPLALEIMRDDERLLQTTIELVDGVGKADFTDRLGRAGAYRYSARIAPEVDAHPGNNLMEQWVEISGGPRILLLSGYENDPLAVSLARQGFSVELVTDTASLHLGQLAGARACIFNNVPAHQVPGDFQKALDFFVRDQGGGLMMVGGKSSFGSGGYYQSPLDALLPVSLELKSEHRKISAALAIVMDRSGSMGAAAGAVTKMDLANNGAVNAINLLGENDYVAVAAVDSESHQFVPLTRLRGHRDTAIRKTRKIQAMGGGIYVYNGLKAAWGQLKKAPSKTRHIILFSDAADSEMPGDYKDLIKEVTANGVSISVIGLGTDKDPDAPLLEDIAKRGNGRVFFTEDARDVPVIFSQETVTIARSAFLTDPVKTGSTGEWGGVSPREPKWVAEVDAYNLSYLKPGATAALVSKDEYLAPLVSYQRVGAGRTMAVSFPLGGDHSKGARAWPEYGDFAQTCARWLMGLDLPPGLALKNRIEGNTLSLDLLYDPGEWGGKLAENPPEVRLSKNGSPAFELMWQRIAPGRFNLKHELEEGSIVRGSAVVGDYTLPFGPFNVGSSAEWAFDRARVEELRHLSATTGGRELLDLQKAWVTPEQIRVTDIRIWLAGVVLLCLLMDALITRAGWPLWTKEKVVGGASARLAKRKKVKPVGKAKAEKYETPATTSESRRARFERSKRRK
jgi:hypothetical protein